MALLSDRNSDGVLISEAAVPAQPAILSGRIAAEVEGSVNTGLALSNPNDTEVRVDFYFTDASGTDFGNGSVFLQPHEELSRFLKEPPFSGGDSIHSAFTFSSSGPVAAIALRGRTNERSEFLMTTLPVVDLDAAPSYDTVTMAHFASGLGWNTHVVLLNPTNGVISGTLQFVNADGTSAFTRSYSIAKNSSQEFSYEPASAAVKTGSVVVSPVAGSVAPVPLTIFGYNANGITVTESGVPTSSGTELAAYIEATGSVGDEVDSGVAIANAGDQVVNVYMRLATSEGTPFGQAASFGEGLSILSITITSTTALVG